MTRKIVIAGNWKMNGTIEDSKVRVDGIKEFLRNSKKNAEVVVCVPFTLLGNVVTNANAHVIGCGILSTANNTLHVNCLHFSSIPTSAVGLAPGTVWNDSGTLKIA